jgi:hypothetical protein
MCKECHELRKIAIIIFKQGVVSALVLKHEQDRNDMESYVYSIFDDDEWWEYISENNCPEDFADEDISNWDAN